MINSEKNLKIFKNIFKKGLTRTTTCVIIYAVGYLGVAQLVARYLGVVEAASSSLVTQTSIRKTL